jgi:phosphoribosyl 1,2-cyclic phosphodiesterase
MNVTLWGTRGSLATPGPDNARYGGNTSCVSVLGDEGTVLVLDAGTGIRRMASKIDPSVRPVDVLLTHLHMDHIQGLGFFGPLYRPGLEVHVWGSREHASRPARALNAISLATALSCRPARGSVRPAPARVAGSEVEIGEFRVASARVCHPGPTVGYRIKA